MPNKRAMSRLTSSSGNALSCSTDLATTRVRNSWGSMPARFAMCLILTRRSGSVMGGPYSFWSSDSGSMFLMGMFNELVQGLNQEAPIVDESDDLVRIHNADNRVIGGGCPYDDPGIAVLGEVRTDLDRDLAVFHEGHSWGLRLICRGAILLLRGAHQHWLPPDNAD